MTTIRQYADHADAASAHMAALTRCPSVWRATPLWVVGHCLSRVYDPRQAKRIVIHVGLRAIDRALARGETASPAALGVLSQVRAWVAGSVRRSELRALASSIFDEVTRRGPLACAIYNLACEASYGSPCGWGVAVCTGLARCAPDPADEAAQQDADVYAIVAETWPGQQ